MVVVVDLEVVEADFRDPSSQILSLASPKLNVTERHESTQISSTSIRPMRNLIARMRP